MIELFVRLNSTQPSATVRLAFKATLTSLALRSAVVATMTVVTEKSVTTCQDRIRERSANLCVPETLVLRMPLALPLTIEKFVLATILFREMAIQLAMRVRTQNNLSNPDPYLTM